MSKAAVQLVDETIIDKEEEGEENFSSTHS